MRILITGGAGFIGSNLCRELLKQSSPPEIVVLDDFSTGKDSNLSGLEVEIVRGSILDGSLRDIVGARVDSIVHLAARASVTRSIAEPLRAHEVNASGTIAVLELARATESQVIVASSSSVYGSNPILPKSEALHTRPMSPYAASKLATEAYSLAWSHCYGIPTMAFRFFNVYGPGQAADHDYAAVIPAFINAALTHGPLFINGDGTQSRDFTYVQTVCSAIISSIDERKSYPDAVNLALGSETTLLNLIELIQEQFDYPLDIRHREPRLGDVPHSRADPQRVMELFPELQPMELRRGITKTVEWFRSQSIGT